LNQSDWRWRKRAFAFPTGDSKTGNAEDHPDCMRAFCARAASAAVEKPNPPPRPSPINGLQRLLASAFGGRFIRSAQKQTQPRTVLRGCAAWIQTLLESVAVTCLTHARGNQG